ncbi:transglycosylase domain-containing protein [Gorillibacterium sp. sgz5001074]|uniref:transglycosylase domain-containing protein n=1 Tax=Gorillibacterium sp. sgz5001074 TaxID=3446695 RepID=UPI003F665998
METEKGLWKPWLRRQGTGPKRARWRNNKRWFAVGALLLLSGLCAAGAAYGYIRQLDVSKLDQPLPEPTVVLDRYGRPASQLSASAIEPVPIERMPKTLTDAVLSVEDRRFYSHPGVDAQALVRALVRNVFTGDYAEGGSTITQQLAKNQFLSGDKTIRRKLKEAAYAVKIDRTYSKEEILETYLNSIYFGEGSWGVQGAAKTYFGKNVEQLTLPESALLAALPKAPSRYSPLKNEEQALERRNTVLRLMLQQGRITEQNYASAAASPLGLAPGNRGDDLRGRHQAYVDAVIEEAVREYGFTEEQLLTAGLRITTELDPVVQNAVAEVYGKADLFPDGKDGVPVQSGAVVLDQTTGGIRAVAGGRGGGVFRGFNRATQLKRQPGSSFKPILVYGPALEKGYTRNSMLYDGPLDIAGYRPQDWDRSTRGAVTMTEAVVQSWNIPPVWLLNEIGIDSGLQFAASLGIALPKQDRQLGAALGGLSEGVSPLQMARAFGAFANQGVLHPARTIAKIETSGGHLLVEAERRPVQAMKPSTAAAMTLMLQEAVASGTGRNAAMARPVAGKSGTTQLPAGPEFAGLDANAAKDAWFVGYTPELTAAIWVGYDRTDRSHYLTTSGGAVPAVLFREILSRALAGVPVRAFDTSAARSEPKLQLDAGRPEQPAAGRGEGGGSGDKAESHGNGNGKKKR